MPEERNGHGAVPGFTLADNAVLTARDRKGMVRHGLIIVRRPRAAYAEEVIRAFAVKATGPGATAGSLSGGNLQKFIMGREVLQMPEVLVVSQPTWGVDAGAAAAIHQALVDLAARGSAIVVISQDLDELLALSRLARGDQRGPAVAEAGGRRRLDRGDRPADGRRPRRAARGAHAVPDTSARRRPMLFELEKRKEPSRAMVYLTPVIAVLLTMVVGAVVFSLARLRRPGRGLGDLRRAAASTARKWQDLGVKAAPLIMIAIGLSIGFRANVWNIGAEGQYVIGGLAGTGVALATWHIERLVDPAADVHRRRARAAWPMPRSRRSCKTRLERQRDPVEPDADLRRGPAALLPDERAVEGPGGLQLPAVAAVQRRARSLPYFSRASAT